MERAQITTPREVVWVKHGVVSWFMILCYITASTFPLILASLYRHLQGRRWKCIHIEFLWIFLYFLYVLTTRAVMVKSGVSRLSAEGLSLDNPWKNFLIRLCYVWLILLNLQWRKLNFKKYFLKILFFRCYVTCCLQNNPTKNLELFFIFIYFYFINN